MDTKKMEIFKSVKGDLVSVGFDASKRPFHREQLSKILKSCLAIILQLLYLVCDANTTREYINSILMTIVGIAVFIAYLSGIFQTTTVSDFINGYETLINGSKLAKAFDIQMEISSFRILSLIKNILSRYRTEMPKINENFRSDQ